MENKYYNELMNYLKNEDKDKAVLFTHELLEQEKISIESLYLDLLAPSLIHFSCSVEDEDICIWKEHLRTSIVRTILEMSYLYILKRLENVKKNNIKVVFLTPAFEYHEIGAIMNTHFFLLEGFEASYIGANTPKTDILQAIRAYHPDYIALSVTNPYNLVITKQTTDEIKRFFPNVKVILGGQAFHEPHNIENLQYDYILNSLEDIKEFTKKVSI